MVPTSGMSCLMTVLDTETRPWVRMGGDRLSDHLGVHKEQRDRLKIYLESS